MEKDVQSPPRSSAFNNRINSLSACKARFFSSLFVFFWAFPSLALEVGVRSNRSPSPASEGRKNGTFSGALGGSLGLLRCCRTGQKSRGRRRKGRWRTLMMSRLSRVCHLARGRSVRVISSVSSCAGVLNALVGSVMVREARASSSGGNQVSEEATGVRRKRRLDLLPRLYPAPRVSLLLRSVPARSLLRCGRRLLHTALCLPYGYTIMSQSSLTHNTTFRGLPEIYADAVHMRGRQKVAGGGEGHTSSYTRASEAVEQPASGNIECPDCRIEGGSY